MIKVAGLLRELQFSPNHELNDYLILTKTADEIRNFGLEVNIYSEDDLFQGKITEDYIFSMIQSPAGVNYLLKIAPSKKLIINSPQSVLNCYRYNMLSILKEGGIKIPQSFIVPSINSFTLPEGFFKGKIWIKRGDAHAACKNDVVNTESEQEIGSILKQFKKRSIDRCCVQEHIEGDTIKFYGVRGKDYFHWYYSENKYKTVFNINNLKNIIFKSAELLGLDIYGGDVIITPEGEIYVIDVNDWPSFAPVRDEASKIIAELIYDKIKQIKN
jgi:glutathione synthase/RimK-type ligase-like ATP-grasp enzyme